MTLSELQTQKREGGFTLVELAIVMIIIGLLIGGILKGQELIANSQVTATVAQIKGIDAAVSTFRDKYAAMPGDMDPTNRLANCTGTCLVPGDLDGRTEGPAAATPGGGTASVANESVRAFAQLSAADLLTGIQTDTLAASEAFGVSQPDAKIVGGFRGIEYSGNGILNGGVDDARVGQYLTLSDSPTAAVAAGTATILPVRAAQIDRKLDDGDPDTGFVRAPISGGCHANAGYLESTENAGCALYIRIQG